MSYEVRRGKAPVEAVILTLNEGQFREVFDVWRTKFPNYYAAAVGGSYKEDDVMCILISIARELEFEL